MSDYNGNRLTHTRVKVTASRVTRHASRVTHHASRVTRFAVMLTLLNAGVLWAQTKEAPPAPGPAKDFRLPAKKAFSLQNGMKVTLIPFGAIPKVDVQLVVRAGNVDEGPNEVWLADLMADLMREGTTSMSTTELNLAAAGMGGFVNVGVSPDETTVSGGALAEYADDIVKLVADVAQHPRFPESELARLKANRLRQVAIAKGQPGSLAQEKFQAVLYPDHPYGRVFPAESMLQGYTIQQIKDFYAQNIQAARAHLIVAGQFDGASIEQTIRAAFEGWARGSAKAPQPPRAAARRAIYIVDRPGAVQSSMYVGVPTLDPSHSDYMGLVVTNTLLGGAFASRITRNIREDKGYTYSPFSTVSTRYRSAYWAEIADVTTNVTGASLKEIFAEIDRLQAAPPSTSELKGIQDYLAGTFTLSGSMRGGVIALQRTVNLHGLTDAYITDYVKKIYAVSPAAVQRIAQQYINDENMVIVIVGDKKLIEEQVKPFGTIVL
jgi:predicted Zn-dependent peptidase